MASSSAPALVLALLACAPRAPVPPAAGLPTPATPDINLVRADLPVRIQLPSGSRPDLPLSPDQPCSPFEAGRLDDGVQVRRSRLPTRVPSVPRRAPPSGWQLHVDGAALPYGAARVSDSWFLMPNWLLVRTAQGQPAPDTCLLTMPGPVAAENARNLSSSGMDATQLALAPVDFEGQTAVGVFLPAPATATWDLTVPPNAHLALDLRLLPPVIFGGRPGDGADLVVELDAGQGFQPAGSVPVLDVWDSHTVDLSAWAGQQVSLRFRTDPRSTPTRTTSSLPNHDC